MERKNPHWIFYVIAILLVVIAVLLAALLLKPAAPSETDPGTTAATAAATTFPNTVLPTGDPESPGIPLDAKWTTLFLPYDLEGELTPQIEEWEQGVRLIFHAAIGEQELELFRVELSRETVSNFYRLGVLNTADGVIYVYTSVNEQSPEDWSEEELTRINALQQRINDLIPQFYEDARFRADR